MFTIASVVMMGVTVLMAIWDTPPWMLPITAVPAALLAFPATLAFLRLRRLRTIPLPVPRVVGTVANRDATASVDDTRVAPDPAPSGRGPGSAAGSVPS
ncbi:hypothetical protein H7H37_16105, partial [Mycolicibacterium insubricum]|nr:hypothetical protein [Mycolicibacterium insubricum]